MTTGTAAGQRLTASATKVVWRWPDLDGAVAEPVSGRAPGAARLVAVPGEPALLTLQGDIDLACRQALDAAVRQLLLHTSSTVVVLDLLETRFLDLGAARRLVLIEQATAHSGVYLVVVGARCGIARLLRIAGPRAPLSNPRVSSA